MANQYSRLTKDNIVRKVNRKKNPVSSLAQLAREFGYDTSFMRADGRVDHTTPPKFRERVRSLLGTTKLNTIRRRQHINLYAEGREHSSRW